jgi:hypothetical protein
MVKVIGLASTRRSMPMRRSSKPASRSAGSHEMSLLHLRAIEGGRDGDLITTIIRAVGMAKSCRSSTTVHLLKMALLNEGIRLADDLSKQAFPAARKQSPLPRLNLVGQEQATGYGQASSTLPSARPEVARPGQLPVADHGCPGACETRSSIERPVPSSDPIAESSPNAAAGFLASFPARD